MAIRIMPCRLLLHSILAGSTTRWAEAAGSVANTFEVSSCVYRIVTLDFGARQSILELVRP